jgi:uncharacterized protein
MPERDHYAAGLPCWVDMASPDLETTAGFYSRLLGWTYEEGPPEAGGYLTGMVKGRAVAGLGPAQIDGGTPTWTIHFAVADAQAAAAAVESNGGHVLSPPMDVMGLGIMAVLADPEGATFAVWQPGTMPGAGLTDEHGAFTWAELMTRDVEAARAFYGAVLGWTSEDFPMGEGTYTVWKVGDTNAGGSMHLGPDQFPAAMPPHWTIYFEVDDCQAIADRAVELGGSVTAPPRDIPDVGRFAICTGPSGETFSVITSAATPTT